MHDFLVLLYYFLCTISCTIVITHHVTETGKGATTGVAIVPTNRVIYVISAFADGSRRFIALILLQANYFALRTIDITITGGVGLV
jgi:hypothetical protein